MRNMEIDNELRKKFLVAIGKIYHGYGLAPINGWIKALVSLENKEMSQTEISIGLSEIIASEDAPTSVPSISRALRVMEDNEVILKTGSRKGGYSYKINYETGIIIRLFKKYLKINTEAVERFKKLKTMIDKTNDAKLQKAIKMEYYRSLAIIASIKKWLKEQNIVLDEE